MDADKAAGMLHTEGQMVDGTEEDVARAVPKFTESKRPEFTARFAIINDDIVIHFFLPGEAGDLQRAGANQQKRWEAYWLEHFPKVLNVVAQSYFQADKDRLLAMYTPEVASWYFRARGFGDAVAPSVLVDGFYVELSGKLSLGDT